MKAVDFIKELRKTSKYTKKDDWNTIITKLKESKLDKKLLELISPVLKSSNIKDKDIELILQG